MKTRRNRELILQNVTDHFEAAATRNDYITFKLNGQPHCIVHQWGFLNIQTDSRDFTNAGRKPLHQIAEWSWETQAVFNKY